jgi:hypothetical protein
MHLFPAHRHIATDALCIDLQAKIGTGIKGVADVKFIPKSAVAIIKHDREMQMDPGGIARIS